MKIPATDGTHTVNYSSPYDKQHDVAVNTTGVTTGTLTVRARKPGANYFEDVPSGTIDLAAPTSITFEGAVAEYEFTLASFTGTASEITITDTSTGGK